ncbi:MAG: DUF4350 domain-containing protein [Verrucomicrobiae bacterium]|nr:DUF4350 domain-containing protein [Verrucomicrobiae bacterium]NNJ42028.1 DUF4350 domain-containing protein [Akkermansiaceae bacterium]
MSAVIVCCLLVSCGETEKKKRTVGYKGEARSNPFLAAQRMLQKQGKDVVVKDGVGGFETETSTLLMPRSSINSVGRAKRLMEWVDQGGHLVMMLEGGVGRGNDFRKDVVTGEASQVESSGLLYCLETMGVDWVEWSIPRDKSAASPMSDDDWEAMDESDRVLLGSEETEFSMGGRGMEIHHWAARGLTFDVTYEGDYGSGEKGDNQHRYLSLLYGGGRVTILSDARPLRNRYIGYADHARLLTTLVDHSRPGTIIFSRGQGDGFFSLVWRYFWMAVLGLLAMVVFWLWKNLPRFGPAQDLPDGGSREFSDQVRGVGRFLWRHQRDDSMLAAMRGAISRRLSLSAEGGNEGVFDQLSERTGLPVDTIIEAMTREQIREPGVMVKVVKNLQIILKHINEPLKQ